MNTIQRVREISYEKNIPLHTVMSICGISRSTFYSTEKRGGQLSVDCIEKFCVGVGITMADFFTEVKQEEMSS